VCGLVLLGFSSMRDPSIHTGQERQMVEKGGISSYSYKTIVQIPPFSTTHLNGSPAMTLTVFVIHQKTPNCFPLAFFFSFAETLAPSERLRPWTGPPVAHFEAPGPHPNENKLAAHRLHRRTHALLSSPLIGKGSKRFSSMLQVAATRMLAREESP
jgi:hypothetical protein